MDFHVFLSLEESVFTFFTIEIFCLLQAESLQAECDFTKEQIAAMKGTEYLIFSHRF